MKDAKKYILIGAIILTIIFVVSFFQFNRYLRKEKYRTEKKRSKLLLLEIKQQP